MTDSTSIFQQALAAHKNQNPKEAKKGTIRNLYAISIDKNSVHGSDSVQNAEIEIDLFFNN